MKFNKLTKVAINAALAGGRVLMKYYKQKYLVEYKGRIDPVTIADKESQKAVVGYIRRHFAEHAFLAEEDLETVRCSDRCWIIDPLDGTVNFIHNLPLFSVSIGFVQNGETVSGVVYNPVLKELFVAEKGRGAYLNGKKISVSDKPKLLNSLVVTGFPYSVYGNPSGISKTFSKVLAKAQGLRRLGSAAIDLAYVACGRFEAFWEEDLKPWDVAAGGLIVREAGGRVTDFKNRKDYIFSKQLLATNGKVHGQMLELVKT
jgi:myo-inositol-1(or 4)-monophosphatase